MPRISLVEAYNNRDVIAWLVKHQDAIDEMMNILQNVNPDGDLTNIVLKTGDQTIDGVKTFIGTIVANCDIIQNGAAYETHAEQLFTKNDYIVMRDGALGGLQPGEFSGFRVNRYDSVHDGHLVMDMNGVARVGDVGDERPLLVRDEAADLTAGDVLLWDSVDQKAIGQAKDSSPASGSTACVTSDGIYNALATKLDKTIVTQNIPIKSSLSSGTITGYKLGPIVIINLYHCVPATNGDIKVADLPWAPNTRFFGTILENGSKNFRPLYTNNDNTIAIYSVAGDSDYYGTLVYTTSSP